MNSNTLPHALSSLQNNIDMKYSIAELQNIFSSALEADRKRIDALTPAGLYEPVDYTLDMGGKRLRPVLVLLGCSLFSEDVEKAIPAALAIEVFHNFTLLHDDIMDKAEVRRGRPCVHLKYDENTAILSGDAMSIMAFEYLPQLEASILAPVLQLFSKTALEICEGQQYDMEFEIRDDVSVDEYMEMIRLKTAVLLACSLKMGAMAGGASKEDMDSIYQAGIDLGLAFQLQDDFLDVYGDPKTFGKRIGGDILSNKKTFILLSTLEASQANNDNRLEQWITKDSFDEEEKIEAVKSIYNEYGIDELARNKMLEYHSRFLTSVNEMNIHEEEKEVLISLGEKMTTRVS